MSCDVVLKTKYNDNQRCDINTGVHLRGNPSENRPMSAGGLIPLGKISSV